MPISYDILEAISKGQFIETTLDFIGQEINDEDAIKLSKVLNENSHIKKLILYDQNIGDIGVSALAEITTIEELDLSNSISGGEEYHNHITASGAAALAKSHLKKLSINGNLIGDEGIIAIASSSTIVELKVAECGISSRGACELFKVNHSIRKLNFSANDIQNEGLITLSINNVLEELDLSYCSITAMGAKLIADNNALIKIILDGNEIGEGAAALANHPKLETIILRECEIDDEGAKALSNSNVKQIRLDRNKITSQGAIWLSKNKTLTDINLSNNSIDSTCLKELISMHSLVELNASDNKIDELGVNIVKEALTNIDGPLVKWVNLSGNAMSKTSFVGFDKKRKAEDVIKDIRNKKPRF